MNTLQEVQAKVGKMRSHEYDVWRSNPEYREEVALLDGMSGSTSGIRRIDLSVGTKPTERVAVLRPCFSCGRDVAVASDHQGNIFCSDECVKQAATAEQSARNVLQAFANAEPRFYRCAYNTQRLVDYFQANPEKKWNLENVKRVFENLYAEGKFLPTLSLKELQAMTGEQYAERSRLDPELGGWRDKIDKKEVLTSENQRREVESAQPSFELSPKVQVMKNAAQNELHVKAASYENRYQTQIFKNGVPVETPKTNVQAVYRNGRRVL